MRINLLLTLVLLLAFSLSSAAKVHSRVSVAASAKLATHIVIATEGNIIDGWLIVLESLKGDLTPGEAIFVPELEDFSSEESRLIHCLFPIQLCSDNKPNEYVTGSRMVLFLRKNSGSQYDNGAAGAGNSALWKGIGELSVFQSTIWVEGRKSYAFFDASQNERGELADFERSEEEIRTTINESIEN
jgi:hypothetical protein